MLLLSLSLHLAVLLSISFFGAFRSKLREPAPYYVDIVSLPALSPAPAGPEPMQAPATPAAAVPSAPPPTPQKPAMTIPAKTPAVPASPSATEKEAREKEAREKEAREQEAREFAQKMSRLEHNANGKHRDDAIAALQKKLTEKKGGAAVGTGTDSGSDYGAYIQSRLKDALSATLVYRSKAPETAVHLYIDKTGKLLRYVMVRPSPDKLFNDSVTRAIEKAKANFPPTPAGAGFDKLFVFSPQEVNK
jgi:colicin import membrane protein